MYKTVRSAGSSRTGLPEVVAQALTHKVSHGLDGMAVFTAFQARVQDARTNLVAFLNQAAADNKRVYGIGASTKGNVLLQYFGIGPSLLPQIGEVNPDKFGAFTPGTHIPLVPEDAVLAANPDYLLVFPWHFRDFFLNNPKFKGRKLVFPLPVLEVVVAGGE
jgi:NDP-4-keto-2,6-dideoxyhexose 3-C-methyltransferase